MLQKYIVQKELYVGDCSFFFWDIPLWICTKQVFVWYSNILCCLLLQSYWWYLIWLYIHLLSLFYRLICKMIWIREVLCLCWWNSQWFPNEKNVFMYWYCIVFIEKHWKLFYGKNVKDGDVSSFGSLIAPLERIGWSHIAQTYLIILFTKCNFFRDAFRSFTQKLEKNAGSSRKKHKIFPILFSFFSELASYKEKFPMWVF